MLKDIEMYLKVIMLLGFLYMVYHFDEVIRFVKNSLS
jgi:hypothetical protein